MNILVTGSNGQLGSEFKELSIHSNYNFTFTSEEDLDICERQLLTDFFADNKFDLILNCAAYTAVDRSEDEKDLAFKVNHLAVKNLVDVCVIHKIKLIHFSTDYVFDGSHSRPYKESDSVSPQGVYGQSKLAGEQEIVSSDISALIIRTSWLYSRFGQNFVKSMLKFGQQKENLNIVYDQIGTPTSAADLAKAALTCISQQDKWKNKQEIYHFSNEGVCSWYDFALEIFSIYSIQCIVNPILSKDYPTRAQRPNYSVLNKTKIKSDFGINISHWRKALENVKF